MDGLKDGAMSALPTPQVEREVLRCDHCYLIQYRTVSGNCRKCHQPYVPQPKAEVVEIRPPKPLQNCPVLRMDLAVLILRHRINLSQRQLAERMDIPRTYISKVEGRKAIPILSSISRLAKALEVSEYQLVDMATL
jgi:ribosome-binding protein aMBF1 (putative translation factor)